MNSDDPQSTQREPLANRPWLTWEEYIQRRFEAAEPAWMQDIRLAQRRIEEQRICRAAQSGDPSKRLKDLDNGA